MSETTGVVYICTGKYQDLLGNSLNSLRKTNPHAAFHVLCDRPLSVPYTWIPSLTGKASRHIKTRLPHHTPFQLNLFVDTDTAFGEPMDIGGLLGDADLAMGLDADPKLERGAKVFLRYPGFTSPEEVEETLQTCGPDFPFYNSGVIIWRQTEKVREFFDAWHSEWLKNQRADQLALARAIKKSDIRIRTLGRRYNFPVLSPDLVHDKAIYHLIFKERIAREVGLWDPNFEGLMDPLLSGILSDGPRAENLYLYMGQGIFSDPTSSTLVVCPDRDQHFWRYCSRGNCRFVVDSDSSDIEISADTLAHGFSSKVGTWMGGGTIPEKIDRPFDYVIVNGPKGYDANCPGREIPVAWAQKLARKAVFVFDYNRNWEKRVCERYLGEADFVLPSVGRGDAELAVFFREALS